MTDNNRKKLTKKTGDSEVEIHHDRDRVVVVQYLSALWWYGSLFSHGGNHLWQEWCGKQTTLLPTLPPSPCKLIFNPPLPPFLISFIVCLCHFLSLSHGLCLNAEKQKGYSASWQPFYLLAVVTDYFLSVYIMFLLVYLKISAGATCQLSLIILLPEHMTK